MADIIIVVVVIRFARAIDRLVRQHCVNGETKANEVNGSVGYQSAIVLPVDVRDSGNGKGCSYDMYAEMKTADWAIWHDL